MLPLVPEFALELGPVRLYPPRIAGGRRCRARLVAAHHHPPFAGLFGSGLRVCPRWTDSD